VADSEESRFGGLSGSTSAPRAKRSAGAERAVRAEWTVGAERALWPKRTVGTERVHELGVRGPPWGRAGGRTPPGSRGVIRARGASRLRRAVLAGLRLLGYGGLVDPVSERDPEERSGAGRGCDDGRRGGNAG
jgi:hypothetical protein